jgi:hypothetical protein
LGQDRGAALPVSAALSAILVRPEMGNRDKTFFENGSELVFRSGARSDLVI